LAAPELSDILLVPKMLLNNNRINRL
jgi:hypothetical protein